jgi:hypothetical protein
MTDVLISIAAIVVLLVMRAYFKDWNLEEV